MPRRHRISFNVPGHAHELTFSCYRRFPLLASDRTRFWLADAIAKAKRDHDFAIWAFLVMPEHVHLMVFPRRAHYDIAALTSAIKSPLVVGPSDSSSMRIRSGLSA